MVVQLDGSEVLLLLLLLLLAVVPVPVAALVLPELPLEAAVLVAFACAVCELACISEVMRPCAV